MSRKDNITLLHTHLGPNAIFGLMRGVFATCRVSLTNERFFEQHCRAGRNAIFGAWHNRLLALPYYYYYRYGFHRLTLMVSKSRDGELFKRLMAKFEIETVRGSTTRGGVGAMKLLIDVARSGRDTALALDGSKGPRYCVQPGALLLAQMSGLPLIPLAFDITHKIVLPTWDHTIMPLPFGHIYAAFADPLYIPREVRDLTPYLDTLQREMDYICAFVGVQTKGGHPAWCPPARTALG
jgi:lysophospholipid acyltransferase (LPLAT)-like uncharacterized protein